MREKSRISSRVLWLNDKRLTHICALVLAFLQWINIIDNPRKFRGNILFTLRGNILFTLRKTNASSHDDGC